VPSAPIAGHPSSHRRGVVLALQIASVVLGFAGALAMLYCASLVTLLRDCSGGLITFCTDYTGPVLVLQWALVIAAFAAPLAGGIASCRRREWWWLPAGLVGAIVMVWLSFVLDASHASPY
jgi:hypothetical protein